MATGRGRPTPCGRARSVGHGRILRRVLRVLRVLAVRGLRIALGVLVVLRVLVLRILLLWVALGVLALGVLALRAYWPCG